MKTTNRRCLLCLALALVSIPRLIAGDWVDELPNGGNLTIDAATLPAPLPLYSPRSALNKASIGGLASNIDYFMSPYHFNKLDMEKSFVFGGVDEWKLNLGLGANFGALYVGVSYGGSLVDELFKRVTNQEVDSMFKRDETTTIGKTSVSDFKMVDSNGTRLVGENANTNTLQILLGAGSFGFKFGLSQYLNSVQVVGTDIFEFSIKPLAELGFHFKAGPVGVIAGLRGAFDFHNYSSKITSLVNYVEFVPDPIEKLKGTFVKYPNVSITEEKWFDFNELSVGFTLGFDFSNTPSTVAELDLSADGALRFYNNKDENSANAKFTIAADPEINLTGIEENIKGDITSDLRISGSPSFVYRSNLSDLLSLGLKFNLGFGFDQLVLDSSVNDGTSITHESSTFRFVPEMGVGLNVKLLPDHFAIYTGLGIEYLSLKTTTDKTKINGEDATFTTTTMGLPSVRLGAGFTFNFTANTAMELLAVSKNLDVSETVLTLLLTAKK
ncbi:MAG: hypothetical protein LBG76_10135 [Treponema sp.]|jgi:opacity protein-like surface antigen|nr:hypothetical protein [Treponema sp.]